MKLNPPHFCIQKYVSSGEIAMKILIVRQNKPKLKVCKLLGIHIFSNNIQFYLIMYIYNI